jgi:hypothetical protein
MANISSNVITLRKLKTNIVNKSAEWSGNTVTKLVNTSNADSLMVSLRDINILLSTGVRYLSVEGLLTKESAGEYLEGICRDGSYFKPEKTTITRYLDDIYFDTTKYKYVRVSVQLNANQSISVDVKEASYLQKAKQRFFQKEWGAFNKTSIFDVSENNSVKLILSGVDYIRETYVRYLNVLGKQTIDDAGIHLAGERENGSVFDAAQHSITGDISIYFDVSKYKYLSVAVQLNPGQSLNAFLERDVFPVKKDIYPAMFGKFPTNGKKYARFYANLVNNTTTTTYAVKGYDYKGNEVEKTLAGMGTNAYYSSEPAIAQNISLIDSFVDVFDCEYIELTTAQAGRFKGFVKLFDSIEEEYKDSRAPLAVRGFRFIKMTVSQDTTLTTFTNENNKNLLVYDTEGIYKGNANLSFKKGQEIVVDTFDSDALNTFGENLKTFVDRTPVFNFNPPKEIDYINASGFKIVKRNAPTPLAELGNFIAYRCIRRYSLLITDTGKSYNECEYEALIDDFPNIGSKTLLNAVFIPYTRNLSYNHNGSDTRLCVQFDDGKIYHNFPNRTPTSNEPDGISLDGDIARFDESVVWDAPKTINLRKFPSKTVPTDTDNYYYDPTLAEENYEIYPSLNQDNGFGNNGFGINRGQRVRMRKIGYTDLLRGLQQIEIDKMYSSIDSYRNPIKNCVFETSDGGRQWFVQADLGSTSKTFGQIDTSNVGAFDGAITIQKIDLVIPSPENTDPDEPFVLGSEMAVQSISNELNPTVTINGHSLKVGNRVVFKGGSTNFDWLLNNNHTENTAGNGQVYRVTAVTDENNIKVEPLAANVNTNLKTWHVHGVNRIKEGWIMSCGEEYPDGWLIYIAQKPRDFWSNATSATYRPIVRLTSSPNAIQRCVGALVLDDDNINPTVIVSMDTFNLKMPTMKVGDREVYSKSSGGIRIGKLADLDDYSKFNVVAELDDSGIGMKRYNDIIYAYGGGSGRFAVSPDNGKTWHLQHWMNTGYRRFVGITSSGEIILEGNYVIRKNA